MEDIPGAKSARSGRTSHCPGERHGGTSPSHTPVGKCSQDKEVINFQAAQLPDLAPCRSTKARSGSPDLERFKMLWPLPSSLLWCKFESPLSPARPSPAQSMELSRCSVALGGLPSVTEWEARNHFCPTPHLGVSLLSCSKALR